MYEFQRKSIFLDKIWSPKKLLPTYPLHYDKTLHLIFSYLIYIFKK